MTTPEAIVQQVREMFDIVLEAHVMNMENGSGFTCSEAEAMHECMIAVGATATAEAFMIAHARTDDPGDFHAVVWGHNGYHDNQPIGWRRR